MWYALWSPTRRTSRNIVCSGVFGIVDRRSVAGSAPSSCRAARADLKPWIVSANCSGVAVTVGPETLDRQRELLGRRSGVVLGPVFLRPCGREILAVPDVVEDVPLGDPDVLEQVPRRVGHVGRQPVDGVVREVCHGGVEWQVGTVPVDEREKLLAQDVFGGHLVPRFAVLGGAWPGGSSCRPASRRQLTPNLRRRSECVPLAPGSTHLVRSPEQQQRCSSGATVSWQLSLDRVAAGAGRPQPVPGGQASTRLRAPD